MVKSLAAPLYFLLAAPAILTAADWPNWLGPQHESVWNETDIRRSIPATGLPVKWRAEVGWGYSGPAVAQGKVFVFDYLHQSGEIANGPSTRNKLEGEERVLCLDAQTGKQLWAHTYACPYNISYAKGPRCTPTVADGHVYALGAEGRLSCLDAETGKEIWAREFTEDYEVKTPIWGFAAHPLYDRGTLYCVVGGNDSVAVAFDAKTGAEKWSALSAEEPGYCPPVIIEHAGVRQLLIWHTLALNALNPDTGDVYWSLPLKPNYGMSITMPRQFGSRLFVSGIGTIAAVIQLDDNTPDAKIVWSGKSKHSIYSGNSTPFIEGDMIYGSDCQVGALIAANLEDGVRAWETFQPTSGGERRASHGTAYLVKHQDRFFLFSETGDLILAKLSPDKYEELGRFHVLEPTNECFGRSVVWSHPAFAEQSVFARNDKEIVCIDLKE